MAKQVKVYSNSSSIVLMVNTGTVTVGESIRLIVQVSDLWFYLIDLFRPTKITIVGKIKIIVVLVKIRAKLN
jgi:hypothetical protein